VKISILLD